MEPREEPFQRSSTPIGIAEKTTPVHAGFEALIARESTRQLAVLGSTEPKLDALADAGRRSTRDPR